MIGLGDGEVESAAAISLALQQGEVTAVELVERALARAQAWQPFINAFSQQWEEEALDTARSVDAVPPGVRASLVAGVPIAVKDLFDVAGHETTGCCAAYRGTLAPRDAPVIERVRRGGLVMMGKTNQHELAAGGTNLVSACGRTGNPWDPARMTGGSSGGSAAAVAAGVVPWALGSDTGGSIRIPASLCGTFGLKPTTGRLPLEGVMPLAPSMDCPGAMATTVADLQALHALIADSRRARYPVTKGPSEQASAPRDVLRVGLLEGFCADVVHDEVTATVLRTARAFEGLGVLVEPRDGRGIEEARRVWMDVCTPEFADAHPLLKDPERRRLVSAQVVEWLERGERVTSNEREVAARHREEIRRWYLDRLEGLDAVLIPTTPYPAPGADQKIVRLGERRTVDVSRVGPGYITSSVNLAGLPALNLPAGRSSEGMPIGVSLIAAVDGEATLFRLATLWEEGTGYRPERPPPRTA